MTLLVGAPVNAAGIDAAGLQQVEPRPAAGRCVADERMRAAIPGKLHDNAIQQRVVAAGDHQSVGEQSAMRRVEYPAVYQFTRKHPFACDFGRWNFSIIDQCIDLFFIQMQVGGNLFHAHEVFQWGEHRRGHHSAPLTALGMASKRMFSSPL